MLLMALLVALLPSPQTGTPLASSPGQEDLDRLVRAAEQLTGLWPSQAPPPIPEVALVARHGKRVAPSLVALLSDDPSVEHDRKRWKVQQQLALALCRIYSESQHCGRAYCDGDPPERIGRVKEGWLRVIAADAEMQALSTTELLDRFKAEKIFWRQFAVGRALAAAGDRDVIAGLEAWLTHDDRHVRGNVAFVLERLGDPRGFATIVEILADRSPRSPGQATVSLRWSAPAQIRADRHWAAHLLGDLKDPRGVELLIPLLKDVDVGDTVWWALGEIGDSRAIAPLIEEMETNDPSKRVMAISALERLNAREALPRLRELLHDNRRSNFGSQTTVAEAAKRAIAVISPLP
jgi:HEAT repeat protein